jgi:hypothetical protein
MTVDFTARAVPAGETVAFPIEHLETVQLNQGNSETLLTMLGLWKPDSEAGPFWGECPAGEFAQRATLAAALDPGTPTPGFDDGRWHQVGSSAGHVAMRLGELAELAWAADQVPESLITWG